jgi:hypothetical protein
MSSSFHKLAGTVLAATATLGVALPEIAQATPNWGQENKAEALYVQSHSLLFEDPCVPQFSVYFQLPERVIAIEQQDGCPVASQIYVYLADEVRRLPPIKAEKSQNYHNKWVSQQDPVADKGQYGVLSVEYLPGHFTSTLSQRDHRITIVGTGLAQASTPQPRLVVPPPQVVEPPQQVVTTLDPESKYLLRNFARWMPWIKDTIDWLKANWSQLEPLIRAIEAIKPS